MTTGQPIKVPSDRNKYNNEFMENLRLQIKLNDQNLQANRLYITTGQMPASTQMADTRSTSEKLADVEGLKRSIVADLSPVAEPAFAYAIINGVLNSPLNIDNSLFRYLAQNAPQIAQQLSKKYKFGIAGDANDVQLLVEFLNDAYSKTRGTFQTIKGYMNSTTNLKATTTNMQDQFIQEFKYFLQRLTQLELETTRKFGPQSPILDEILEAKGIISEIIYSLPNQQQMNQILSDITSGSYNQPFNDPNLAQETPVQRYDDRIVKLVIEMIENLPNFEKVRTLLNTLEKGIRTGSQNIITSSLRSIEELFNPWIIRGNVQNSPFQDALEQFRATFLREANEEIEEANRVNRISTIRQIEFQNNQNQRDAKAQRVYVINPGSDPVKVTNGPFQPGPGDGGGDGGGGGGGGYASVIGSSQPPQSQYSGSQDPQSEYSVASGWNDPSGQALRSDIPIPSDISENLSLNYANIYPEEVIPEGASFMPEANPQPKFSDVSSGKRAPPPIPEQKEVYSGQNPSPIEFLRSHHYNNIRQLDLPIDKKQELAQKFEDNIERFQNSGQSIDDFNDRFARVANDYIERFHHDEDLRQKQEKDRKRIDESFERQKSILIPSPKDQQSYNERKAELKKFYGPKDEYKIQAELAKHNAMLYSLDPDFHKTGKGLKKGRGISSDYRDFGINKINHKKLDDGILTLRRKSNTNIPDMPSKRISRKLQKIIKHISGGGVPDYNDLNSLDDNEKDYLHKLISKSNLNDRLSVPAPSKDQEEKDFHQFEVMKGEIMSGNDSRELVKKFKVLILKLSKQNVLPRNEVQELLEDLLSLGY